MSGASKCSHDANECSCVSDRVNAAECCMCDSVLKCSAHETLYQNCCAVVLGFGRGARIVGGRGPDLHVHMNADSWRPLHVVQV